MPKRFDPYHAWLGIPLEEQPPNHYRLLGISLFESDPDVIQNGLDQRLTHVKSFATGPRAAVSQRLLTEVSQAGVCLLRPEKKQIYDKQLKSTLTANAETVEMQPAPAAAAVPAFAKQTPASPSPSQPARQTASPDGMAEPAAAIVDWDEQPVESGFPMVPAIVGCTVGLGVACLVLFMLSPGGTSTDTVAKDDPVEPAAENLVEAPGNADGVDAPDPPGGKSGGAAPVPEPHPDPEPQPKPPEFQQTQPPGAQPPPSQPTGSPFQPSGSQPLPGSPQSPPTSPQPQPGGPFSPGNVPSTPQGVAPVSAASGTPSTAPVTETSKSIVLDLERSTMHITLVENADAKKVRVQIRKITNLATPYDLQPADGVIRLGQPVDVVLTQYAGVKIHLSVHVKGKNTELEVAPEIETGRGRSSDFSNRTLDSAGRSMQKDAVALNRQLVAAQSEALGIRNWLASPALKPLAVRGTQTKRLNALTTQVIPTLQQQMAYIQTRADVLQQLSSLVKQIHKKASLDLLVQVEPADKADKAK